MKLKLTVNKGCVNKTHPDKVADGWLNIFEDMTWLEGWVKAGYGWASTHFADRRRRQDNARGSNCIVIDIDGDTTLTRFWNTTTARQWCAATYTSSSHTEEEHRFRAIFPLEMELDNIPQHKGAYWLIVNRLLGELELDKLNDDCGQKPERLWYGNKNAVFQHNSEHTPVPTFLLETITYEEPTDFIASDVSDIDVKRCQWLLKNFLRPSDDGEYESYFLPVMAACAGIGDVIYNDWCDWVLRGHHGQKEENTARWKWRGLGSFAGHTTLYGMCKKQDANWTRALPSNLRFGAVGTAAGYTEYDPLPNFEDVLNTLTPMTQTKTVNNFEPEPLPDVEQAPTVKKRGRPKRTADDLAKERESDVDKVKELLPNLRRNELTSAIEHDGPDGMKVELQGNDLDLMTTKLAVENGVFIPEMRVKAAVQYAANRNRYCPIQTYLNRCLATVPPLKAWDRVGEVFLGNAHPIATLAMQRMMIGAVARAYNPGCSMSWLPILVGAQGIGKSMFSRGLVPDDLFAEVTTPLETLMKEQYRLHVAWLLELPEIDNYFSPKNIENFKNLITARTDEVRRPYASLPESLRRRFVMIGTTNRNQFLVDSTGNRRFVPLEIGANFLIPWKQLIAERDALWSAAITAWKSGQSYEFTAGEIAKISDYIAQFGDPDPWMEKISSFCNLKQEVTVAEVLTHALDLDPRQQGRRESKRVVDVLQTLNWRKFSTSRKDPASGKSKSTRVWQRPKDDPLTETEELLDF